MNGTQTLSRFKASLVGAVIGDCLGAPFEGYHSINMKKLLLNFNSSTGFKFHQKSNKKMFYFTDDTVMTRCIGNSIVALKNVEIQDIAKKFVEAYFQEPDRGYGYNVVTVFRKLRDSSCLAPHHPASEQFNGSGSFGNGGAMRIAPLALFYSSKPTYKMLAVCSDITKITHSHVDAIEGAQLICVSIRLALIHATYDSFCIVQYIDELIDSYRQFFKSSNGPASSSENYLQKLIKVKEFLKLGYVSRDLVVNSLGNDVSAFGSVTTAIYSFLLCYHELPDIKIDNPFERTILYSISLGGDTDTIASMSGSIAGAFYGIEYIPLVWKQSCEGVGDAEYCAEQLYYLSV